jgi:putative phosphoribosyl transferase
MKNKQFADRRTAGALLATLCAEAVSADDDVVVLGLPRGGVPVAFEVARALDAPLDVIVVRKLGVPSQPELAMGAIGENSTRVLNARVLRVVRVSEEQLARVEAQERDELARRVARYRGDRPAIELSDRVVFVVDDGIATGATARAACEIVRQRGAARVLLAAPVAPPSTISAMRDVADEIVTVMAPESFYAIGEFYRNFTATSDEEVDALLRQSWAP